MHPILLYTWDDTLLSKVKTELQEKTGQNRQGAKFS